MAASILCIVYGDEPRREKSTERRDAEGKERAESETGEKTFVLFSPLLILTLRLCVLRHLRIPTPERIA